MRDAAQRTLLLAGVYACAKVFQQSRLSRRPLGRIVKKKPLLRLEVSCFAADLIEQDSDLTCRTMCSVAGRGAEWSPGLGFSPAVFIACSRRSPSVRNQQGRMAVKW